MSLRNNVAKLNVALMHNFEPMSTRQVAKSLRLSVRRVQQIVDAGELPGKKLPGITGSYIFDPQDVEAYREAREARATSAASA